MPSITLKKDIYELYILNKNFDDVELFSKDTVILNFKIVDCVTTKSFEDTDMKIRYSVIFTTGAVSTPKVILIKTSTPLYNLIKESTPMPLGVDYDTFKKIVDCYYIDCKCKICKAM